MKCLKISISTNVVSTKWYHLGINATFFATEARIYLKRCIDNVSFRAILGLRVRLDFLKNAKMLN